MRPIDRAKLSAPLRSLPVSEQPSQPDRRLKQRRTHAMTSAAYTALLLSASAPIKISRSWSHAAAHETKAYLPTISYLRGPALKADNSSLKPWCIRGLSFHGIKVKVQVHYRSLPGRRCQARYSSDFIAFRLLYRVVRLSIWRN